MSFGLALCLLPKTKWALGKLLMSELWSSPQHPFKRSALLTAATWLRTKSFNTALEPYHADCTVAFASLEGKQKGALKQVLLMSFCPNREQRSAQNTSSGSRFSPNRVGTRVLSSNATEPGAIPVVNLPIRRRRYRRISSQVAFQLSTCFSGFLCSVARERKH